MAGTEDSNTRTAPLGGPPGPECPLGWSPDALAPVFFGRREYGPADGAPMRTAVYFPSLDGAASSAPILTGCGRYPLLIFVHGHCRDDADHFRRWHRLPAQLARAGNVVLVPQLTSIGSFPVDDVTTQQDLVELVDWARDGWEHAATLMPPPATGVAGHSFGALHAGILATRIDVAAVASLSGEWIETFNRPSPLFTVRKPWLLTWGTDPLSERDATLREQEWDQISRPKHRAVFTDAMHFDYLHNVQFPCRDDAQGPCRLVGPATDDLVTMFFARYLPPEGSPELPDRIPADLRPPPLQLSPEQEFFAGGYLNGLAGFAPPDCRVDLTVELANDRLVPRVRELVRNKAREKVLDRDLAPVFTGSGDEQAFVFSQSPQPNTPVPRGTSVRMRMRSGQPD